MDFCYNKLGGRIKEVCGTQGRFARMVGISGVSLSKRLNNNLEFTQQDIHDACVVLGINVEEIPQYFFDKKVQKQEQTGADYVEALPKIV